MIKLLFNTLSIYLCIRILKIRIMETKEYFEKVMRKYKRFSKGKKVGRAYEWLVEYAAHNRNEFSHWVKGFVPYPRLG